MRGGKAQDRFRPWLLGAIGLLSLASVGCKRQTASPLSLRVTRLIVSEASDSERPALGEALLHASAERGLLSAGLPVNEGTSPDPQDIRPGDFQLRMQLQTETVPKTNTLRV